MNRRSFLISAAGACVSSTALGYTRCRSDGQLCEAGVRLDRVLSAHRNQTDPQWCWAASVQMIFAHYGYAVSQPRIVLETYGEIASIPAVTGLAITKNLERRWTDDDGRDFEVSVEGLYDYDLNIAELTNEEIISALDEERPLIIGNRSHAMVMTAIAYVPLPGNPLPVNYGVADPYPGAGLHGATSPGELRPMHLGGNLRYLCLPTVVPA